MTLTQAVTAVGDHRRMFDTEQQALRSAIGIARIAAGRFDRRRRRPPSASHPCGLSSEYPSVQISLRPATRKRVITSPILRGRHRRARRGSRDLSSTSSS
ncbi:hypothetical protein F2981_21945 (plasmid) [Sinorhizobium meliloti]|nr:hypothetical protein [Sinorhizobium meliloti]